MQLIFIYALETLLNSVLLEKFEALAQGHFDTRKLRVLLVNFPPPDIPIWCPSFKPLTLQS